MAETRTCACGAEEGAEGQPFQHPHGHTSCIIFGRSFERAAFQRPAREIIAALRTEQVFAGDLSQKLTDLEEERRRLNDQVARLQGAIARWRAAAVAQAACLSEEASHG